jgi:hypothetical protein
MRKRLKINFAESIGIEKILFTFALPIGRIGKKIEIK